MVEVAIANKHLQMEKEFALLCKEKGYEVIDLSYHHNYSDETAEALRRDYSPASLSVRVSPDLLIQKESGGLYKSSFVELKTGNSSVMQAEAFQLLQNKVLEKNLKTPCLYIYRGKLSNGKMIACNAEDIRVSKLVIPNASKNKFLRPILLRSFEVPLQERDYINGYSNDPYVEVSDLTNWFPITEYLN